MIAYRPTYHTFPVFLQENVPVERRDITIVYRTMQYENFSNIVALLSTSNIQMSEINTYPTLLITKRLLIMLEKLYNKPKLRGNYQDGGC